MPHAQALLQLQAFEDGLRQFEAGHLSAATLSEHTRDAQALLTALPVRYGQVLLPLLDRLESSALFTEESCSFSQEDLRTHLFGWIDKAKAHLTAAAA